MQNEPFWLDKKPVVFPPTNLALTDPDGLLAIGGDLTPEWLLSAYSKGIFPWFNPGEPVLWWTPNPRSVLLIDDLKFRRSLRKNIQKLTKENNLTVTFDQSFIEVMKNCATIERKDQDGTWITDEMLDAYQQLHNRGHAHSVEVWLDEKLVGGLYGVAIGKMFFGESMFSKVSDGSKIALVSLAMQLKEWGFKMMDTQIETAHLKSLGANLISRNVFEALLEQQTKQPFPAKKWQMEIDWVQVAIEHSHFQKALEPSSGSSK
ncbi:MAG: leucyl/phenylalanyl-tRNA--protein transferase [Pseudomonadota bacterium]|nr:leucyl/phenylalanyl-tRNA--protein transferase [Pseudomonadota bacterium]